MTLPDYVCYDFVDARPTVLLTPAARLSFPLNTEDLRDIQILEEKYDNEENCAGLAAPQLGIAKSILIFEAPDDPELKKWRPDLTQTMPKTLWINPSYTPLPECGQHEDYEACFSVKDKVGVVRRYNNVRYEALTREGLRVEGTAEGFLARIIQHEIDHVDGILFIDRALTEQLFSIEEYREKRRAAMQA
jgi:peptide deformylase